MPLRSAAFPQCPAPLSRRSPEAGVGGHARRLIAAKRAPSAGAPYGRHGVVLRVVEGELTLFIGDGPGRRAPAGAFAHLPGGTAHGFRVESEKARYLILTTPRHGQFYRAITRASRPGNLPPLDSVQGSEIQQASMDYGVEFVGPLPDRIE